MKFTQHQQADSFLNTAKPALEQEEAANNLMLGICMRLQQFPEHIEHQPYLATVSDADELIAAAVMTPPYKLIVYAASSSSTDAFHLIAQNLMDEKWTLPGVNGPAEAALAFAQAWSKLTRIRFENNRKLRVYELKAVEHPQNVPGQMRIATQADVDLVAEWLKGFHVEALPDDPQIDFWGSARLRIAQGYFYIWEDQGKPVCMAASTRPTYNGITVNAVYTPPEARRKGYATACVAQLSQLLLDQGYQFCSLFTDLSNPTSNSIYQKIGYKPVCDFHEFQFDHG